LNNINTTVWVVEDSPAYADALSRQVASFGVRVVSVDSVGRAFPTDGDIVLLDLMGTQSNKIQFGGGVRVYTMSACADFRPNLVKPLTMQEIKRILFDGGEPNSAQIEVKAEQSIVRLGAKAS